jgi:broad specificity phosphatase PhoE
VERLHKEELVKRGEFSVNFIRHSSKGPDGNLTPAGIAKAQDLGVALATNSENIVIYTSNIQRAKNTGKEILSQLNTTIKPRVRSILSEFPYTDEKIEELGLGGGKWLLLKDGNEHLPSTKFMAGKIAKFLLDNQAVFTKLDKNQNAKIIAVSHIPPMMCFIGHIIAEQEGKDFIDEDIKEKLMSKFESGFFKPLEGFEVMFNNSVSNNCWVDFCNEKFTIPFSLLFGLAGANK